MDAHDASPAALTVQEADDRLLLSWDKRRVAKQWGSGCVIVIFFIPSTLLTLFFTLASLVLLLDGRVSTLAVLLPPTIVGRVATIGIGRWFFDRRA